MSARKREMKIWFTYSIRELILLVFMMAFLHTIGQTPACTALSIPANGETNVALDINFEWVASDQAENYILVAGTSSGSTDILNNVNVGDVTSYVLPNMLPAGQTIFVRIIPENSDGQNINCAETSFDTTTSQIPDCVDLQFPMNGIVDVPTDTTIEWMESLGATGYRITIGSSTGNNDLVDNLDVGNSTTYDFPGGFALLTSVFLTIVPYNDAGSSINCPEFRFTITNGTVPRCTQIINPQDGTELVPVNANITWIRDFTATGYLMTIRIAEPDGDFLLNEENVGNGTNFKPPDFEPRTKYFVTVTPFNSQGNAVGCQAIEITTGDPIPLPDCPNWIFPSNGASNVSPETQLSWSEVPNIDGFILSIGTSLNGTEILNQEDVGNRTSYELPEGIPMGTTVYVKLNSYEGNDNSESCPIISFVLEGPDVMNLQNNIPKFFTPNNDGFNDLWKVVSTENISVQKVFVFDRFGKLLKQLSDGQGWDGTFNGQSLPASSYWYSVELLNAPRLSGFFMLKR